MKTFAKVYLMRAEDGALKLGHSKNPTDRSKQVGRRVDVVHETDVLEQAEKIERLAHRVLALHGKHIRGEWFEATLAQGIEAIEIATRQAENAELALGTSLVRAAPTITVPLRLSDEILEGVDAVVRQRGGAPSRNAILREAILKGLEVMRKQRK